MIDIIKPINFPFDSHNVRVVTKDDAPWFIAQDVCEVLEISKYRDAVARLDEDEGCPVVVDTLGGPQSMSAVNESGLYSLILTSRKPEAKRFKKWITSEVLPSIRKTGGYGTPSMPSVEELAEAVAAKLAPKLPGPRRPEPRRWPTPRAPSTLQLALDSLPADDHYKKAYLKASSAKEKRYYRQLIEERAAKRRR